MKNESDQSESTQNNELADDLNAEGVADDGLGELDRFGEHADETTTILLDKLRVAEAEVLRSRAEMENYRKRMQRDADQQLKFANVPIVRDLLDVIDNLNRALEAARGDETNTKALLDGVQMVSQQFTDTLAKHGCKSQSKKFLKPFYDQYVREISRPDMATSLELAATLYSICKVNQFSKLLDLGSGFSSFVFRKHSKLNANVIVYSVDDDTRWLGKTREYLIDSSVSADNLMTLSEFIDSNENQFDIVLLDLNFVEVRKNYIKLVIDRCKIGGLIFFDDVHKQEFMTEVLSQASNLPVDIFDVKNCTLDEFGRFAVVAIKKK